MEKKEIKKQRIMKHHPIVQKASEYYPQEGKIIRCGENIFLGLIMALILVIIAILSINYYMALNACCSIQQRIELLHGLLETLHKNWIILLILIFPMFYRPLRKFVEELKRFWHFERNTPSDVEEIKISAEEITIRRPQEQK